MPAAHALHDAWPLPLYVPAGHIEHAAVVAPLLEYEPAWHTPLTADKPVPAQYLPAGHAAQAVLPVPGLYEPAGHALHAELVPLPAMEYDPGPHSPLPLDEAQPARQYAPAGHAVHDAWPLPLYVPAGHEIQLPAPLEP